MLAGIGIQDDPVHLRIEMPIDQLLQNGLGRRLIDEIRLESRFLFLFFHNRGLDGQQRLDRHALNQGGHEPVINQNHLIRPAFGELLDKVFSERLGQVVVHPAEISDELPLDGIASVAADITALLSDGRHRQEWSLLRGVLLRYRAVLHQLGQAPDDIGVVDPAQPLVGSDGHQETAFDRPPFHQRVGQVLGPFGQALQHLIELVGEGTRRRDAVLSPAQLGRRHQLHGARDFFRILDAADAPLDLSQACHASIILYAAGVASRDHSA